MSAETWGGRLYGQMKLGACFTSQPQMDADLLPADIMQSVLNGALSASYYFDPHFSVKKDEEKSAELLVLTDTR